MVYLARFFTFHTVTYHYFDNFTSFKIWSEKFHWKIYKKEQIYYLFFPLYDVTQSIFSLLNIKYQTYILNGITKEQKYLNRINSGCGTTEVFETSTIMNI